MQESKAATNPPFEDLAHFFTDPVTRDISVHTPMVKISEQMQDLGIKAFLCFVGKSFEESLKVVECNRINPRFWFWALGPNTLGVPFRVYGLSNFKSEMVFLK